MIPIVLVGTSTPVAKVLQLLTQQEKRSYPGLMNVQVSRLFTELHQSPEIENLCSRHDIPLFDINLLKTDQGINELSLTSYEWLFSVNSTVVLSQAILDTAAKGCFNMHPGRLPDYAGLHTHQWAIRNGETSFAATLHWMSVVLDTGPIAYQAEFPVMPLDTGLSLFMKCLNAGSQLVLNALDKIGQGEHPPQIEQDLSRRRLYRHQDALDGSIPWKSSAQQVVDFIRAADYRPLTCPTYQPAIDLPGGKSMIARAAIVGPACSESPGTITSVGDEGVAIAVGHHQSVLLITAEYKGRSYHRQDIGSHINTLEVGLNIAS